MLLSTFANLSYIEKCGQILLYFTIALIATLIAVGMITKKFNSEKLADFSKYAIGIIVGYALCATVIMLTLTFDDMVTSKEIIPKLFYPLLSCIVAAILLVIGGLIISLLKPAKIKAYALISLGIFTIPLIVSIVMMSIYYNNEVVPSGWYSNVSNLGLWLGAGGLIIVIVAIAFLFGKKNEKSTTRSLVYAAVCVALSFALSYIRLFKLPQGGSVTFASALPIMLYSYMFGIRKGVAAGLIYGILQAIQDPWIIHPAQFILDYPVAFSAFGLAGLMKEVKLFSKKPVLNFVLGGAIGGIIRYICHVFSGIFAFSSYAAEGYGAVTWSFLYNTFALVDLLIVLVAGGIMLGTKYFSKFVDNASELE
jgi:thiamine transporter